MELNQSKIKLTVFAVLCLFAGLIGKIDHYAIAQIDQTMFVTGLSFAAVRVLDAALSVMQSFEGSIGIAQLQLGQLINPFLDLINDFADILLLALSSLTLQRILATLFSHPMGNVVLAISVGLLLLTLWSKPFQKHYAWAFKVFKVVFMLRFSVAIIIILSSVINHFALQPQIESNSAVIETLSTNADAISSNLQEQASGTSQDEDQSMWEKVKSGAKAAKSGIINKIDLLVQGLKDTVTNIITLMVLFVLNSILLPIGFLWWLKRLVFSDVKSLAAGLNHHATEKAEA